MEDGPLGKIVPAMVPLGEMFGYATDLRSQTQGRASYVMEFGRYAAAPKNIADAVIAERQTKEQFLTIFFNWCGASRTSKI